MEQVCNKCGVPKELKEFTKNKKSKNGYTNTCKVCTRNYMIAYEEANKEKLSKNNKEYRLKNSDKNKKYLSEYNKKPEVKENKHLYYLNNIQYYRDIEKTEERKEYRYNYNKNSYIYRWRMFLSNTFKRMGKLKEGHTIDLLGYSALDLKNHLESLFTDGMTWDNYGEWHIDHITPLSKFNPDTPINIINALSNLQPLWATTREINGIIYIGNHNKYNN